MKSSTGDIIIWIIEIMNHKEFIKTWLWKANDYDKTYWMQCTDIVKQYSQDVLGVQLWTFNGSAINAWNTWSPFNQRLEKIENYDSFIPKVWDIVFFNKTASNKYWHVAIVSNWTTVNSLKVIEQNGWMGKGKWEWTDAVREHIYNFLVPKVLWFYRLTK